MPQTPPTTKKDASSLRRHPHRQKSRHRYRQKRIEGRTAYSVSHPVETQTGRRAQHHRTGKHPGCHQQYPPGSVRTSAKPHFTKREHRCALLGQFSDRRAYRLPAFPQLEHETSRPQCQESRHRPHRRAILRPHDDHIPDHQSESHMSAYSFQVHILNFSFPASTKGPQARF